MIQFARMTAGRFIPSALAAAAACVAVLAAGIQAKEAASASRPSSLTGQVMSVKMLEATMEKLRPLHKKLGKPRPGDWLYHHQEPGQSFRQYIGSRPVIPDRERRVIYIQPIGQFTPTQRKVVSLTADWLGRCFNLPVKVNEVLPLSVVPAEARRTHPNWGDKQILTTYVLDRVLRPRLAKDAFALIAFTASDLWPGPGWNFVFGQASLRQRVGVWSIYRFGDPAAGEAPFRLCLLRTMKTGTHELGHMFSMLHCTAYQCGMCGSNSLPEADRRPLALCPECMAKVCWATQTDPVGRYRKLEEFCRQNGLAAEAGFYDRSLKALGAAASTTTPPAK
jgi:archaemetzincin